MKMQQLRSTPHLSISVIDMTADTIGSTIGDMTGGTIDVMTGGMIGVTTGNGHAP